VINFIARPQVERTSNRFDGSFDILLVKYLEIIQLC